MKSLVAILSVSALVGCAESDQVDPLLSEGTSELAFDILDTERGDAAFTIDVERQTMTGYRFELRSDLRLCRRRVDSAIDMTNLRVALEAAELVTLSDDSCEALGIACGGAFAHDLGVRVNGGERYSASSPCRQLVQGDGIEGLLDTAFQQMAGIDEEVVWNGSDYDVMGECPPSVANPQRGH